YTTLFRPAVQQPHVHLAEVELRELAGHALEAHHERSRQRGNRTAVEPVERALAEPHPFFAQLTKDLERRRLRVFRHERDDPEPHPLPHARPAHAAPAPLLRVTRTRTRRLLQDPLDGALRDPKLRRDLLGRMPRLAQGPYGMSIQHPEHPPLASSARKRGRKAKT